MSKIEHLNVPGSWQSKMVGASKLNACIISGPVLAKKVLYLAFKVSNIINDYF